MMLTMFLLLASTAKLAGAVCQDDTCALSLENGARGERSMLQQSAMRSAPVDVHQPEREAANATRLHQHIEAAEADVPAAEREAADALAHAKEKIDLIRRPIPPEHLIVDPKKYPPLNFLETDIIDRKHKMIMGWAPRAASAATVNMFLKSAGMYTDQDMLVYPWIHDYREAMGNRVKPQGIDMNNPEFLKFKIVRNPYSRAVSSWLHQTGTNFSNDPRIQGIAAANGVDASASFLDWLQFVKNARAVERWSLDAHSFPQFSFWEYSGGRYEIVLQLEDPLFNVRLEQLSLVYNCSLVFEQIHVGEKHVSPKELYTRYPEASKLVEELYEQDFDVYLYPRDVSLVF